jgi:hypothetical protein
MHTCSPGVEEACLAKKATGAIYGKVDLAELENTIDLVVDGKLKGHQIRGLLCKYIPPGYEITSDSLCNFKEQALNTISRRKNLI